MPHRLAAMAVLAAFATPIAAQDDILSIPGPIELNGISYEFAWSSHPTETFYKHEYVPEGQTVEAYDEMFLIDVLAVGQTPEEAAAGMVSALGEREGSDPLLNFELIENEATGEYILDFILSAEAGDGLIVEWNAYRYVAWGAGVAMYGVSHRAYGEDEAADFLTGLGDLRQETIAALAQMELPEPIMAD
jgi:hypothetical protein